MPQLLEYFEKNSKDVSSKLILEVLKKNGKYATDIENVITLSKEISKKHNSMKGE